jgi:hypothetical protein
MVTGPLTAWKGLKNAGSADAMRARRAQRELIRGAAAPL